VHLYLYYPVASARFAAPSLYVEREPALIETPDLGVYNLEDVMPDLAERFDALFKKKYKTQHLTDRALDNTIRNGMLKTLWDLVLSKGSDIKITSVELSLVNTDIYDKRNGINYTVDLLINEAVYEVNGVLGLVLVDDRWQIDVIREYKWSPFYPQIKH